MALQRPRGLTEEVYDSIFNKLVSLEIAPGARVTVDALVRELEVCVAIARGTWSPRRRRAC